MGIFYLELSTIPKYSAVSIRGCVILNEIIILWTDISRGSHRRLWTNARAWKSDVCSSLGSRVEQVVIGISRDLGDSARGTVGGRDAVVYGSHQFRYEGKWYILLL